jgi:hypothetical protein
VASVERRIEALEAKRAMAVPDPQARDAEQERVVNDFMVRALDAMASIKRAPIDREPYRYGLKKLREEGPMAIAAHVAALANLEHEDEAAARQLLEEKTRERSVDPVPLEELIETFAILAAHAEG